MGPQRRRPRSGRLACVAGVAASVVLVSGPGSAVGAGPVPGGGPPASVPTVPVPPAGQTQPGRQQPVEVTPQVPESSAPVTRAVPPVPPWPPAPAVPLFPPVVPFPAAPMVPNNPDRRFPAFGAYLDYGPRGVEAIDRFSDWLGGTELRVGHTYLPGDRWSNIEGAPGFLDVWAEWRRQKADRMFVLNVPMMERNEEGVPDDEVRRLLGRGAAGEFDHHFRRLAERLVELRALDTVIVLGWEMNGNVYTHRCGPDPENWKRYWKRIVTTMRSVPGQRFRFDWAPNRGRDATPWTQCYPGDDTVDIIGMDSYDQPSGLSFDQQVREPYGLQAHVDFAKARRKPFSYPEWGLFRNGDNPEYMRGMLGWMHRHKPLYQTITDYCPHGVWQCAANPKASQAYRSMLSGRTDPTDPMPELPPVTPTPVRPPHCTPVDLGDWLENWLGDKLCLRAGWWPRDD
ncbi:glycoside hydrolase family 26 protein [Streptomyces bluensis]|uniref:glycoside hydrolase family 26 protein n=1 Tax=Streptomyces bluensis TaxID=33897 RepID=UPI003323356D